MIYGSEFFGSARHERFIFVQFLWCESKYGAVTMGEAKRRELIFNATQLSGQEYQFDHRELIPKYPDYRPRAKWGWGCFCIFNDKNEVCDLVILKLDGSKGYSNAHGEFDHARLQQAKEMWQELCDCKFQKRIVNYTIFH